MSNTNSRFVTPDPSLAVGSTHQGFTVVAIEPLPELSGTGYVMRHDASGARLLWIAVDDNNKSFAIAFKTPPADDTGVFHILEHSVLCGSDRFPVKEPFVNLLKSSMQTFLNALTFPDKTMYPVASTNVTDLENLMDVYLDAVLHPAIYHHPRIFEQEGWHLELEDLDAPLTYNGVVFNEMKGALSDPDEIAFMNVNRALFPDTAYCWESGGDPRAIPTLTYERFLDTHSRHYNLANSYTILYGDLDIERELAFVGTRFDGAAKRAGTPNELTLQAPIKTPTRRVEMATAPENASVTLAYVVGTAAERERVLATDILLDVLAGSNEAPLKRAVLEAGLGEDLQVQLIDGELQPQVLIALKGARPNVADEFKTLVEDTCARLASEGLERARLEAGLAQAEFNLREGDWGGYPDGVALAIQVMASWLYDDEHPVDYLRYQDAMDALHAGLETGYFERLLREVICESQHSCAIELVPVEEGDAAEEIEELARRKAAMDEPALRSVMDEVAALRAEQEREDTPEALATLPRLTIADIEDAPAEPVVGRPEAPLPCLAHELDTHRIDYVYHYFDLRRLNYEDLPYVGILTDLLGKLGTERMDAAELDTVVEESLGNLSFFFEMHSHDDDPDFVKPILTVSASSLSEKVDRLATLPSEVWSTTRFDDLSRIHNILLQRRIALEQRFMGAGHISALSRLASYFSKVGLAVSAVLGVDYYLFLKDLLDHWDERSATLPDLLEDLSRRIFTSDEAIVSFVGPAEDRTRFWELGGTLGLSPAGAEAAAHRLELDEPQVRNEAFVVPANVCFVAEGQPKSELDEGSIGTWQVASRALSFDYLWNEVRVKGGAYGVGFRRSSKGTEQYYSYRDPAVDPSIARFEQAASWIENWNPTDEDFAGYIVSVVAGHDAPIKPRLLARRQDGEFLADRPEGWHALIREEILDTTPEKVRALAPALAELPERRAYCVFGGRSQIEASGLDLTVIELMGEA